MKNQKYSKCLYICLLAIGISSQNISAQKTGSTTSQSSSQATPTNSQLGNYRNEKADQYVPLEAEKRQVINTDLQATVVELLELQHDAKQSHWNVFSRLPKEYVKELKVRVKQEMKLLQTNFRI